MRISELFEGKDTLMLHCAPVSLECIAAYNLEATAYSVEFPLQSA